jgi:hypothetical protein
LQSGEASPDDVDVYARTAGNLRRLLEAIGLQRRAKPVEDLQTYLARAYGKPESEQSS